MSREDARSRIQECLRNEGIGFGPHFRKALADDGLEYEDARQVIRSGGIYREPECSEKTGDWKYTVEGYDSMGRWVAIVFTFTGDREVFLITAWEDKERRKS